jgi:hypothetical protein
MKCHFFTRQIGFLSCFRLVLFIFGCAATPMSGALAQWTTVLSNTTNNGVRWEVGYYFSDNLQIYGLICTPPASTAGPGPYPIAILNHGVGGANNVFNGCTLMAQYGWLTAISAYRGESLSAPGFQGTSQGLFPDICNGDVDDVRNLLSIVTAMTGANGNQVFMWGHSEGSCITELAIEKGAKVQIAVSIDGPTDFTTWSHAPNPLIPNNPDQRSSAKSGNNPASLNQVKFLRIQAEGDTVVTPDQACELAMNLPVSVNWFLNWNVSPPGVYAGAPKDVPQDNRCSAQLVTWVNANVSKATGTPWVLLPDEVAGGTWPQTALLMYGFPIPGRRFRRMTTITCGFHRRPGQRLQASSIVLPRAAAGPHRSRLHTYSSSNKPSCVVEIQRELATLPSATAVVPPARDNLGSA